MRSDEEELEDLEPHTSKFRQGQLMSYEEDPNFEGYLQVKVCVCVGRGEREGGGRGWLLYKASEEREEETDSKVKNRERRKKEREEKGSHSRVSNITNESDFKMKSHWSDQQNFVSSVTRATSVRAGYVAGQSSATMC